MPRRGFFRRSQSATIIVYYLASGGLTRGMYRDVSQSDLHRHHSIDSTSTKQTLALRPPSLAFANSQQDDDGFCCFDDTHSRKKTNRRRYHQAKNHKQTLQGNNVSRLSFGRRFDDGAVVVRRYSPKC